MNLKWEYHAENIGTNEPVAKLLKGGGNITVLQVYAGTDCYFTRPCGDYAQHIDRIKVPYEDANLFVENQKEIITKGEKEISKVEYACALFESNFQKQSNTILSLFS